MIIIAIVVLLLVIGLALFFFREKASTPWGMALEGEDLGEQIRAQALQANTKSPLMRRVLSARLLHRRLRRLLGELERAKTLDSAPLDASAEWFFDNARMLESTALSLKNTNSPHLPLIGREVRVLLFARLVLAQTGAALDEKVLRTCLDAWQSVHAFTLSELAAMPRAFSQALTEAVVQLAQECLLMAKEQLQAQAVAEKLKSGNTDLSISLLSHHRKSPAFFAHLYKLLRQQKNASALSWLDQQLEKIGLDAATLVEREQAVMTLRRSHICAAITSLHLLSRFSWADLLESTSLVEQLLLLDPSQVYQQMTDSSRGTYRSQVERIARKTGLSEITVARTALDCAREHSALPDNHVGTYLLDEAHPMLAQKLGNTPLTLRLSRLMHDHPGGFLLVGRVFLTLMFTAVFALLNMPLWSLLFCAICSSSASLTLLSRFIGKVFPPRLLPSLKIDELQDDQRTLVVVPTLLTSAKDAQKLISHLEVLYHAGGDPNLHYLLLGDFKDGEASQETVDKDITSTCLNRIKALDARIPSTFFYMHRERAWNGEDKRFMGAARKRGAIMALLQLIREGTLPCTLSACSFDPISFKGRYAQIITLDSDTIMPPGSAHRLIGQLLHPLCMSNVIAPRMETSARLVTTHLADILGGPGGVDPYQGAVSDMYQDLCGMGSFCGKGIIRVDGFYEKTKDVPARFALSHDLLEGEIARSALSEDVAFYDGQCTKAGAFFKRLHRWTRGDWQLFPWLFSQITLAKDKEKNPLSLLSRLKIYDNLRRSLVYPCQFILFFICAVYGNGAACLLVLVLPMLGTLLSPGIRAFKYALMQLTLLPRICVTSIDAAIRALYRQFVSKKNLLNWVTASDAEKQGDSAQKKSIYYACAVLLFLFSLPNPGALFLTLWISLLFAFAPRFTSYLDTELTPVSSLSDTEKNYLMKCAQATWHYYEKTVTSADHFLPPDNLQLDPHRGVATRTSPTNIALYMLSCVGARLLDILEPDEMARKLEKTMDTLEKLRLWQGHLYNWYDTRTLAPMAPVYVSSVDSGNLLSCLIACAQALRADEDKYDPSLRTLAQRIDQFVQRTDLASLYDESCDLFFIGLSPDSPNADSPHYDLLASESRLLSYVAVASRKVKQKHWSHLSRTLLRTSGGDTLASWSGTMFEYLMPTLLLRSTPNTLLHEACEHATLAQIIAQYPKTWGISESGYYRFDPALNYQYHAFGLPSLALRNERFMHVIAPYASALALKYYPHSAIKNLMLLQEQGVYGSMGFYESVDYTVSSPQEAHGCSIVKSHMAHHQGMLFCAIVNALTQDSLVDLFHSNANMEAFSLLLEERMPRTHPLPHNKKRDDHPKMPSMRVLGAQRRVNGNVLPVKTQLLHGGGTTLLCDTLGGGYLRHHDIMLTRWRNDPLHPSFGIRFYLRVDSGDVWQCTTSNGTGEILFDAGEVTYKCLRDGLQAKLSVCVNPMDGTAIHQLSMHNTTQASRHVRISSFMEVALSTQDADEAHRAFSSLFVTTAKMGSHAVIAQRRRRKPDDHAPQLLHALFSQKQDVYALCDRSAFIGTNAQADAPAAMYSDSLADSVGDVIDPSLSLLTEVEIKPGESKTLCYLTCGVADDDKANEILASYTDISAAQQALSLAHTQAQVVCDYLSLDGKTFNLCQLVGSMLSYPIQNRQRTQPLAENTLPFDALYSMSLGGQLPILLVITNDEKHLPICLEALKIHEALSQWGLSSDLVFITPGGGEYIQPIRDAILEAVSYGHAREKVGVQSGVHLLGLREIGNEKLLLLKGIAALTLVGSGENAAAQVRAQFDPIPLPYKHPFAIPKKETLSPHANDANGYGAFLPDGAYCILRNQLPPSPWCNILSNEGFGCITTESGMGFTYVRSSHDGRITPWTNDPVLGRSLERLLLHDENDGSVLDAFLDAQQTIHEPGFSRFTLHTDRYTVTTTVFIDAEKPMRHTLIEIENLLGEALPIKVEAIIPFLMDTREGNASLVSIKAHPYGLAAHSPNMSGNACVTLSGGKTAAYKTGALAHIGCASTTCTLVPKQHKTLDLCLIYQAEDQQSEVRLPSAEDRGEASYKRTKARWEASLNTLTCSTQDKALDALLNRWLPYQVRASRIYARAGFYQAGGAIGYRDQLQDMLCLLTTQPDQVRDHILLCAAHQFEDGDVQHWWHPPARGVRTKMSDDLLFLPFVTACYVYVSGDHAVLDEAVPYLRNVNIPDGQEDAYVQAQPTSDSFPLRDHCLRAFGRVKFGTRGLPLIGTGDWNDAMNRVGHEGLGESVWLGFFFVCTLRLYAKICGNMPENFIPLAQQVFDACETEGWDGAWYRRAYMDDGTPLGSRDGDVCRIDCIAQCWAVLSGADSKHANQAMDAVMELLYDKKHALVKLLTPPFITTQLEPGYIKGYLPGVRENGGQYTHGAAWAVIALSHLGRTEEAWEVFRALLPTSHTSTAEDVLTYRTEPYAVAADVYANEQHMGRGGWTWYTGSASWLYVACLHYLIGFDKKAKSISLKARLPQDMNQVQIVYKYQSATYELTASKNVDTITLDGVQIGDTYIPLVDDGKVHTAQFPVLS